MLRLGLNTPRGGRACVAAFRPFAFVQSLPVFAVMSIPPLFASVRSFFLVDCSVMSLFRASFPVSFPVLASFCPVFLSLPFHNHQNTCYHHLIPPRHHHPNSKKTAILLAFCFFVWGGGGGPSPLDNGRVCACCAEAHSMQNSSPKKTEQVPDSDVPSVRRWERRARELLRRLPGSSTHPPKKNQNTASDADLPLDSLRGLPRFESTFFGCLTGGFRGVGLRGLGSGVWGLGFRV